MNGEEPRTRKFENKRRGGRGGGSKSRRNADLTEVERERAAMRFIVLWRQKAKLSIGEILDRRTTTTMPLQTANATEEMLATPSFSPTSKEDERATSWITGSVGNFVYYFTPFLRLYCKVGCLQGIPKYFCLLKCIYWWYILSCMFRNS